MSEGRARLAVLATAVLFSTGGAALKACALPPWQVAGLRSLIAAAALACFFPRALKAGSWRTLAAGLPYAGVLVTFAVATKLTTAANAIYLQSTAPIYLLLLGPWLLKERPRASDAALAAVIAAGLALAYLGTPVAATAPDPVRGNALALLSGVFWALTLVALRRAGRAESAGGGPGVSVVLYGNLWAFLACLPTARDWAWPGPADAMTLGYLGVFQIGLAYALLAPAFRHVPALEVSLLLLLEPVLNPLWTWVLHGERPGGLPLAGGALILAASAMHSWAKARPGRPKAGAPVVPA